MASILNNYLEVRNDILNCTDEVAIDNICKYIETNDELTLSYIDTGKEIFKSISFGADIEGSKTYYVIDDAGNTEEYSLHGLKNLIESIGKFKLIHNGVKLNNNEIRELLGIQRLEVKYIADGREIASSVQLDLFKNFSEYIMCYIHKYKVIDIINDNKRRYGYTYRLTYNEELNAILCIAYKSSSHKEVGRYKIDLQDFSKFLYTIHRMNIIIDGIKQSIIDMKKFSYINGFDMKVLIHVKIYGFTEISDKILVKHGLDFNTLKEVILEQSELDDYTDDKVIKQEQIGQIEKTVNVVENTHEQLDKESNTVEKTKEDTPDKIDIDTIKITEERSETIEEASDKIDEQVNEQPEQSDDTNQCSETVDEDTIEKESYNPSYEQPEQLKKLFNCQDKKLKSNVRELTDEVKEIQQKIDIEKQPLSVAANENKKLQEHGKKSEQFGCEKCNYTTYIDIGGIQVRCDCVAKNNVNSDKKEKVNLKPEVKIQDVNLMNSVIPPDRRNDEFSSDVSKQIVSEMLRTQGYQAYGYLEYIKVLNKILSSIATNGLSNSYIIGAPNGFSKTTFVYTAIKRLIAKGKKVVPYKSLTELAEIRLDYNNTLLKRLRSDKIKQVDYKEKEFTWKDYVNCDVLFTYLSSAESREIESVMLYDLIKVRSKNGKPTVVMTSQSLQWYTSDAKLMERYWSDMLSYKGQITTGVGFDRLIQVSCYKRPFISMGAKKGVDY